MHFFQSISFFFIFYINLITGEDISNLQTIEKNVFRCEVPELGSLVLDLIIKKRNKRFVLNDDKWVKANEAEPEMVIDWQLKTTGLNNSIEKAIETTANSWAQVIDLIIQHNPNDKNVLIVFELSQTADKSGKQYDIVRSGKDIDLFTVTIYEYNKWIDQSLTNMLLHIWGHLLGLLDSSDPNSIMYPFFAEQIARNLSQDDIAGVQTLYGINPKNPNIDYLGLSPNRAVWSADAVDLCLDSKIDSVLELPDGRWMFFKGLYYYEIGPVGQHLNSPRKIKWDYKEVDPPIDATLSWSEDIVFFFKGNNYWKYKNKTFVSNRKVSDGFNGIPDGPFDDVFQWNINQKTYFFKGKQFWKYDSKTQKVAAGYPKDVSSVWSGIPESFDAAISSRKRNQTIFFKDNTYYRFDDISKRVVNDQNPPYPRLTQIWILKCRNTQNLPKWATYPTPPPFRTTTSSPSTPITETDEENHTFWVTLLSVIFGLEIVVLVITVGYWAFLHFDLSPLLQNLIAQRGDSSSPAPPPASSPAPPQAGARPSSAGRAPLASETSLSSGESSPESQTSKRSKSPPKSPPKRAPLADSESDLSE